jgi:PAS domain S-box-containing protein
LAELAACPVCGEADHASAGTICGAEPPPNAAADRDLTAAGRDRAAELRDRSAEDRDAAARQQEQGTGDNAGARAREQSEHDRARSAADRGEAAGDRHEAARERVEALHERARADDAAERALETLESMSDAFLTLDAEWRFTYLNPQTEAILGRPRDELLGANMWEAFPEAVGSRFEEEYRRAATEGVPIQFEEHYSPLGRTLQLRLYPVPDGLAVYFRDVTSERLLEDRQRQTQRLEMLGQVTAGVAHDFNNLLAAIGGFADLGRAKATGAERDAYYFDQISAASKKATMLTRQLLTFGRAQALSPALIDLNGAVGDLYSLLAQLLPPPVELQMSLSPTPVLVFADPSQIEQVLVNLVVNSRDSIDSAGSITVSTTTVDPVAAVHDVIVPSGWLQVSDTGSGITDDVLPHIFDPYFSTKPPDVGTGLGLATIYGIVSQSGGAIFVESTVGAGTTMTVALPRGAEVA